MNYILPGNDNNILWLGTNNGLVRFDILNSSFTVYGNGQGELLRSNPVWALQLHEGYLWIGASEGLLRFSVGANKLERVRDGADFGSKVISGINIDSNGELWLSTTRGITRYNPYTGDSKSFSIEDGLDWNTYTPGAFSANVSGTVAFGGIHGLTLFNPHKILVNTYRSPVVITGFDVFNESGMLSLLQPGLPPDSSRKIILTHAQDNFRVSFVTFNFRFSGKNRYFYKLEGVDADWRDAGNTNSATYSHIGSGEYVFRVKAKNNDMKPMANEASVIIIIHPPLYATLWFRLMLLIAGVAVIAGAYYLRVSNLKKMQIKLETEVEKRTAELQDSERSLKQVNATKDKFFSIIAHDLRSPFQALISYSNIINTEFDSLPEEEKKGITAHIEYVARSTYDLLENLLKWSFTQTNKMVINPSNIDLFFAVNKVLRISGQSAKIKNISVYTEIPVGLTVYADADMLETIFRNLLGNAIKFTHQGGSVTIKAAEHAERVAISIADTGVGMSEERLQELFQMEKSKSTSGTAKEKGSGLGLLLCKEFTEMQSGSLEVASQLNTGTTFTIRLPRSKE
ncbi:MAG: hypothetical protein HYV28_16015 [Ignavibacteriales bacterium]|nr:hypothetical protein [Ignavibacteriales bacterium]